MKHRFRFLLVPLLALLFAQPIAALAHGYTTAPISRAVWCRDDPRLTGDCGPVRYEPQSVEGFKSFPDNSAQVPDGTLCAGGQDRWKELNSPMAPNGHPWPRTTVYPDSEYTVHWHLTAVHATTSFRVFVTKPGWDDTHPLTRADLLLNPISNVPGNGQLPLKDIDIEIHWPDLGPGHQLAYLVWDIADTSRDFVQCADLQVPPE